MDYFSFLGLPRKLHVDRADLEQRYRALSRQLHPDFFYNATPAERRASLERSSYLNDAYRTLRNQASRIEYLLKLENGASASQPERGGGSPQPPAALLEDVFALNEELDEIRDERASGAPAEVWKARVEQARLPIERKRDEHEADLEALSTRWDELVDAGADDRARRQLLDELHERFLERKYIANLLEGIERELSQ